MSERSRRESSFVSVEFVFNGVFKIKYKRVSHQRSYVSLYIVCTIIVSLEKDEV